MIMIKKIQNFTTFITNTNCASYSVRLDFGYLYPLIVVNIQFIVNIPLIYLYTTKNMSIYSPPMKSYIAY